MDWVVELRKLTDSAGISDAKMASQLGVSKQYFSAVITRAKQPSVDFKLVAWTFHKYILSLDSVMFFFLNEVRDKLVTIERKAS